jgi:uncharacterized protein YecE (DUF72 family)
MCLPDFLVGTGGWAYFPNLNKPSLKLYSQAFNFVEVNQTFYDYPDMNTVERWRKTVPENFTFAVRCHQVLTHRLGFETIDEAYYVLGQMVAYCGVLNAPFLVLETPHKYVITKEIADKARDLFSSWDLRGVRLVWEIRAPLTQAAIDLMQDFGMVHCVDLSWQVPVVKSDVVYSRLFGKGTHNVYQFTDSELVEIDRKAGELNSKVVALSYHGARMGTDALRFTQYKKTGNFLPVTAYTGLDSARVVLSEDAVFPTSKQTLISDQGWKVVDLSAEKRVHLSDLLSKVPEKTYASVDEVVCALETTL